MKRLLLLPVLLFFAAGLAFSLDFGLLAEQKIEAENTFFSYSPVFTPWLSWNGGKGLSLYLSALLTLEYINYSDDAGSSGWGKPALVPELGLFAVKYRFNRSVSLEAGRVGYSDALGFAASGLFDGVRIDAALPLGTISAGVFYTGLLYKETALVLMTEDDAQQYAKPWDFDDFDGYFASRRALAAFRWGIPLGNTTTLTAEILAQFDLTGSDQTLNSQYGELKFDLYPMNKFMITIGALFEALENNDGDFSGALGALFGFRTDIPGSLNDRLNIIMKFSSGFWNDNVTAFVPLSSVAQGSVFQGTLSGLALVSADYSVRLHDAILLEGILRYFMRTHDDPSTKGNLYGGEVWASLAWQPLDDIRLTLGGGVFLPGLGNVYPDDTDPLWKINAALSLSF